LGGTARSVEFPEVEPPRSGIAGATDGPMTSPLGDAAKKRKPFAGMKRYPDEGNIIHMTEGLVCPIYYDEAAIERVRQRTPWLLPELLAELDRNNP
jgi:hypothetical protein